jgi:hypothetical protein
VTPASYAYPAVPITDARRYGYAADGTTNNSTALTNAMAVFSHQAGGTLRLPPGQGNFATGVALPANTVIQGAGGSNTSTLKYTGSGTAIQLVGGSSANCVLRDILLVGTSLTGVGIQVGDTAESGQHRFEDLNIQGFATGVRMAAALWTTWINCVITANSVGLDWNAGSAGVFSNSNNFYSCTFGSNNLQGIKASNVPVFNAQMGFFGCTFQDNCVGNTALPQVSFQAGGNGVHGLLIDGFYTESLVIGGTNIHTFDMAGCAAWEIRCGEIIGGNDCFRDSIGGASSEGFITKVLASGQSGKFVNFTNATDIVEFQNLYSGAITLTGSGCRSLPTGAGVASWPQITTPFTPVLAGTGGGPPTYTVQAGCYSKVGNVISFAIQINTSALGALSGGISITGMPIAAQNNVSVRNIFSVRVDGFTFSGSNTYLEAGIQAGASSITIDQCGAAGASGAQITASQLAATCGIFVSGTYQASL